MSNGPIQQWWNSHRPPVVTTRPSTSIHAPGAPGRAACGRRGQQIGAQPTCSDCLAAMRADAEAASHAEP